MSEELTSADNDINASGAYVGLEIQGFIYVSIEGMFKNCMADQFGSANTIAQAGFEHP